MIGLLRRLLGRDDTAQDNAPPATPAQPLAVYGERHLDLAPLLVTHDGLPHLDWNGVHDLVDALPEADRDAAWTAAELAWLHLLRDALGPSYRVLESPGAFVLTALPGGEGQAALRYVDACQRRVGALLEELASADGFGKAILLVFADQNDYYRYVSRFYPEEGEFALSAGMYVNAGCGHFMVHGEALENFEVTIVHETTHERLAHLPIPAWLNEGMAVNAEQRLTRIGADIWTVQALEAEHRRFWNEDTIQEFWSGAAYVRPDKGSELAYDLGRILVNGMSSEWAAFKRFVRAATLDDAGDAAAREHMHLDLGEFVRQFLDAPDGDWGPRPAAWPQAPERGAF